MDSHESLNRILAEAGVTKIVYALVMPETEQTIDAVYDGQVLGGGRDAYHHLFREAWTQKQDRVHEAFFLRWMDWTQSVVRIPREEFPFCYPIAGASEGLREAIHAYGSRARQESFLPTIHCFEGEYEGFGAYARAAAIPVVYHRRSRWRETIESVGQRDQFYISQPSAIDGCLWDEWEAFVTTLMSRQPSAEVMLDLSYVGCVARDFHIDATSPNVQAIFFSLSKPAGVYYHRIGGMLSRKEYLGLFGNKWFKNIASLAIGTAFMERYGVRELPTRYASLQKNAIQAFNQKFGLQLKGADIFLLGIGKPSSHPSELERYLMRGSQAEPLVRVCLTARLAYQLNPKLNPTVAARYYESLGS